MRREFSIVVRQQALRRALYRCENPECLSREKLQFHHVGDHGDNSLFNCQVLCEQCHATEEQRRRVRARRGVCT